MRQRAAAATIAALPLVAGILTPAHAVDSTPRFRITDSRITEASGLALGIRSHALYVHNDSGDRARFFALDAVTGVTLATYDVTGARNVDWEDMAVARDAAGIPSVWLADIGDNDSARTSVQLYRVDEPQVPRSASTDRRIAAPADVWNLRYPDGAHDAETLIVDGSGRAFVVTKSVIGASGVYEVPASPSAALQTMQRVGSVRFTPTSTPGPFGIVGHLTATGGTYGAGLVVIRTYTDAYVWSAPDGVVAALKGTPERVPLPRQQQGEGVCIERDHLLVDSEGTDSPVYAVPLAAPRIGSGPGGTVSPAPSTSQPVVIAHRDGGVSKGTVVLLVLAVAGVVFFAAGFGGVGLLLWIRRRRRM